MAARIEMNHNFTAAVMDKIVTKRTLAGFRKRENPWKNRSYEERWAAMLVICGTNYNDGDPKPEFPRVYRAYRRGEG